MLLSVFIGIFGGMCAVLAVRFFESLQKNERASLADGIEIIEDDVLG